MQAQLHNTLQTHRHQSQVIGSVNIWQHANLITQPICKWHNSLAYSYYWLLPLHTYSDKTWYQSTAWGDSAVSTMLASITSLNQLPKYNWVITGICSRCSNDSDEVKAWWYAAKWESNDIRGTREMHQLHWCTTQLHKSIQTDLVNFTRHLTTLQML